MGYASTHYWDTSHKPEEWAAAFPKIVEDATLIIANAKYPTAGPLGGNDPRIVSSTDGIRLNGLYEDHEPFELTPGPYFTYSKTARKPYDETVTAILVRAKIRAGSAIKISSDGDWVEWQAGRELVARVWPNEDCPCPFERTSCKDYDAAECKDWDDDDDDNGSYRVGKLRDWACPVPGCYKTFWEREDNLMAHIANVHLTADEKKPGYISPADATALGLGFIDARL